MSATDRSVGVAGDEQNSETGTKRSCRIGDLPSVHPVLKAVAMRASAGKAALYRRWPSKLVMAREALDLVAVDLTATPEQETLAADVMALLVAIQRVLRHPLIRRIVPDLNAELARSVEFAAAMRPFQEPRRGRGEALLRRAITRGELRADLDIELAMTC